MTYQVKKIAFFNVWVLTDEQDRIQDMINLPAYQDSEPFSAPYPPVMSGVFKDEHQARRYARELNK